MTKRHGRYGIPEKGFQLTRQEHEEFVNKVQKLVVSTIYKNEDYLENGRPLNKHQWKPLREHQGLKSFKEYGPTCGTTPTILSVGIIPGTLDDVMLSCVNVTEDDWRCRSILTKSNIEDHSLLSQIVSPCEKDPFQSLNLVSFVHRFSLLKSVVDPRDFLVLQASGMARDSKGRRVGYFVNESVQLPRLKFPQVTNEVVHFRHERSHHVNIVRAEMSSVTLFREFDANTVEVYCRASLESFGSIPEGTSAAACADIHLSLANYMDFSYVKKLRWIMSYYEWCDLNRSQIAYSEENEHLLSKNCNVCEKQLGKLIGRGSWCQICRTKVCSRCSLKKQIAMDSLGHNLAARPITYCSSCMIKVGKISAREVALASVSTEFEEQLERQMSHSVSSNLTIRGRPYELEIDHDQRPLSAPAMQPKRSFQDKEPLGRAKSHTDRLQRSRQRDEVFGVNANAIIRQYSSKSEDFSRPSVTDPDYSDCDDNRLRSYSNSSENYDYDL